MEYGKFCFYVKGFTLGERHYEWTTDDAREALQRMESCPEACAIEVDKQSFIKTGSIDESQRFAKIFLNN